LECGIFGESADGASSEAGDASVSGSAPGSLPEVASCGQGVDSSGDEAGNSAGDATDTTLDETLSDRRTAHPPQGAAGRRSQQSASHGADSAAQAAHNPAPGNLAEVDGVPGADLVDEIGSGAQTGADRNGRPNARRRPRARRRR